MDCYDEKIMKSFRNLVEGEKSLAERVMNKKRHLELRQDILHKLVISVIRHYQDAFFSVKFIDEVKLKCFLVTEDKLTEKEFEYTAISFIISYKDHSKLEFTPCVNGNGSIDYSVSRKTAKDKHAIASSLSLSWAQDNNGGHWFSNSNTKNISSMSFTAEAVTILLASLSQDN